MLNAIVAKTADLKVQHRFTRLFPELRSLNYIDRLKKLKLWTLEERRNRADLIELYKMSHGITSVPLQKLFILAPQHVPTRGHSWNWLSLIVALMQEVSSSLFESSTDGTAYHKKQLMPALWTCSRTSWTGFGTAGWVSIAYGLMVRITLWLYNARMVM